MLFLDLFCHSERTVVLAHLSRRAKCGMYCTSHNCKKEFWYTYCSLLFLGERSVLMRLTVRRGLESCGDCALRPYDMNRRFQMQGGKNWILPEIDLCKPVLLGISLAGNLVKPLLSLYGTEWRERGYGLWRERWLSCILYNRIGEKMFLKVVHSY